MAHDVFISYATDDRQVAEKVCAALEGDGIKCWIAPRDVPIGVSYEQAILDAIEASTFLVLLFSAHANASHHVEREIRKAFEECSRTQVFPFRLEDVPYNKTLYYYLGGAQWVDASTPPLEQHLGRLVEHVRSHLSRAGSGARTVEPPTPTHPTNPPRDYDSFKGTSDGTPVFKGTGDRRKPFPFALVAAFIGALVLTAFIVYIITFISVFPTKDIPANAVNQNTNNAPPTPQRTPTPTPNASPTPMPSQRPPLRNVNLSRNLNFRRVR